MTELLPRVAHTLIEQDGVLARRVDLVVIGLLALLLLEYELLRTWFGGDTKRLRPLGIAIGPLAVAVGIVIAHRWRQLGS